jgi:transcription initiation factor TFIIIB Brf1 subunit/transcription initiation factor TFIIB
MCLSGMEFDLEDRVTETFESYIRHDAKNTNATHESAQIHRVCRVCDCNDILFVDGVVMCSSCNCLSSDLVIAPHQHAYDLDTNATRHPVVRVGMMKRIQMTNTYCSGLSHKDRSDRTVVLDLVARTSASRICPAIIEDTKALYKDISTHPSTFRVRKVNLMAACLYEACKRQHAPRSAKEIASIFMLTPKAFSLGCKHYRNASETYQSHVVAEPADFLPRFASNVGLSREDASRCLEIVCKLKELNHVMYNSAPQSLAAAVICLCNPEITSKQVSESCGVSIVTIDRCIKDIANCVSFMAPPPRTM